MSKSKATISDSDSEAEHSSGDDSLANAVPTTVSPSKASTAVSGNKTRSSWRIAAKKVAKTSMRNVGEQDDEEDDAQEDEEDDGGEDNDEEDFDGEDELPLSHSRAQTRATRSGRTIPSVPPSKPRLFSAGVHVPPLPRPRATEISLPAPRQPKLPRATGYRHTKDNGPRVVNCTFPFSFHYSPFAHLYLYLSSGSFTSGTSPQ